MCVWERERERGRERNGYSGAGILWRISRRNPADGGDKLLAKRASLSRKRGHGCRFSLSATGFCTGPCLFVVLAELLLLRNGKPAGIDSGVSSRNHGATDRPDKPGADEGKGEIKTAERQEVGRIKAPRIVLLGDEGRFLLVEYQNERLVSGSWRASQRLFLDFES